MVYVVYIKPKKGITRGGIVRTPGRRPLLSDTKVKAEKIKKRAIKQYKVGKKNEKLLNSLIKVRKL